MSDEDNADMVWVPFKIFIHKAMLDDPLMVQDLGTFYAIQFLLPQDAKAIILAKESELEEEERIYIEAECDKFVEKCENEDELIN